MAQVFMHQSTAAQSQPDLLGLPYTTHENVVMRKRDLDLSLSITGELASELNSRLSMPPFVLSSGSLRSFENSPSTSSSYATDMASRPAEIDQENASGNSDIDTSLNEPVRTNLNNEMEESPNNMQTLSDNSVSMNSAVHVPTEDESYENSTFLTNSENEGNDVDAESPTNTSPCPNPILNEEISDNTIEIHSVDVTDENLNNCRERNIQLSEQETLADAAIGETVLQEDELMNNDGNNEVNSEVNDAEEFLPEASVDNIAEESTNNVPLAEQDLPASADGARSSEDSLVFTAAQPSQHEVLSAELPPDERVSLFGGPLEPVNEVDASSNVDPEQMDDGNQSYSSEVNDPNTETEDSSNTSASGLQPLHREETDEIQNSVRQTNSSLRSFENDTVMFGRGNSFMDLESEPDIMNVLSLSNNTTSDVIMPTNSADIEGTSPRRTVGTCNLRTLFQIPDRENASGTMDSIPTRIQQDEAAGVDMGANVSGDNTVQGDFGKFDDRDNVENNDSASVIVSSVTQGSDNVSRSSPSSGISEIADSSLNEALLGNDNNELDGNSDVSGTGNDRGRLENAITDAGPIGNSTDKSFSQNSTENSDASAAADISQLSNDELTSPAPAPSITHVQYLRSKHLSIRLPSRTASPLPVVHVVSPKVPVSPNDSGDDLPANFIEAEPVLAATRLDPPLRESTPIVSRSLARDVFDAPDGLGDDVNVGASTSSSISFLQPNTSRTQTSSASGVSHLAQNRKSSSSSSQSGNTRNKRKNKSRSRTSRNSSATEPTEFAESTSGQVRARRRVGEERANRILDTTEETNDESASSNRGASIYVQISDFPSEEDVLDEPLPQRKCVFILNCAALKNQCTTSGGTVFLD